MQESISHPLPNGEPDPDQFREQIRERRRAVQEKAEKERSETMASSRAARELLTKHIKANSPEAEELQQRMSATGKELTGRILENVTPEWQIGKTYRIGNTNFLVIPLDFRFMTPEEGEPESENVISEPLSFILETPEGKTGIVVDAETGFVMKAWIEKFGQTQYIDDVQGDLLLAKDQENLRPVQKVLRQMEEWNQEFQEKL